MTARKTRDRSPRWQSLFLAFALGSAFSQGLDFIKADIATRAAEAPAVEVLRHD